MLKEEIFSVKSVSSLIPFVVGTAEELRVDVLQKYEGLLFLDEAVWSKRNYYYICLNSSGSSWCKNDLP